MTSYTVCFSYLINSKKISTVSTNTVAYTGQVTFYKVPETYGHACVSDRYVNSACLYVQTFKKIEKKKVENLLLIRLTGKAMARKD